jgi:glutathione synthase/RimK-type ligase-like ATP-grasp enzyme
MKPIALATSSEALPLDADMPLLLDALGTTGLAARPVCWDDPQVHWDEFAAVVLRSTWDYVPRLPNFLVWADAVTRQTRLFNPRDVVRWSTDKRYLRDLAKAGVPVVPTRFVDPGDDARAVMEDFLDGRVELGSTGAFDDFVAKPAVGAGSKDALRASRREVERARLHVEHLLAAGRTVLLQPYLPAVDDHGETAVIYLEGRYSHAIRKGALLRSGADLVDGLFALEDIHPRDPDREEGRVAKLAFNAIPFETPLYARVDLLRGPDGGPVVLELELVEPSLFFAQGPGSALRFAEALRDRLAGASKG